LADLASNDGFDLDVAGVADTGHNVLMSTPTRINFWPDKQFGVAFLAAPFFWAALWWWSPPGLDGSWPWREAARFIAAALVYPVLEEIVFRAGLQAFLRRYARGRASWSGITLANLGASLAFVVAHLFTHDPLWAAATLLPSLVFGYFFERHDSLASPIALHVFYNAGYFWLFGH